MSLADTFHPDSTCRAQSMRRACKISQDQSKTKAASVEFEESKSAEIQGEGCRLRTTYLFTCFSMFSLFLRACKMAQPRSRIMRRSDTDVARLTDRGKRGKHKDPKRIGSHSSHRITKTKLLRRTTTIMSMSMSISTSDLVVAHFLGLGTYCSFKRTSVPEHSRSFWYFRHAPHVYTDFQDDFRLCFPPWRPLEIAVDATAHLTEAEFAQKAQKAQSAQKASCHESLQKYHLYYEINLGTSRLKRQNRSK